MTVEDSKLDEAKKLMAEAEADRSADDNSNAAKSTSDGKPAKTFTQEEVNDLMTKQAREATRKANQDLASKLGSSIEDAAAIVAAEAKRKEDEKSELVRAQEALAAEQALAAEATRKARQSELRANLITALMTTPADAEQGSLNPQRQEAALAIAMSAPGISGDMELSEIVEIAVGHARKAAPELFGTATDDSDGRSTGTLKAPVKTGGEGGKGKREGFDLGADLYESTMQKIGTPVFPSES